LKDSPRGAFFPLRAVSYGRSTKVKDEKWLLKFFDLSR
jgi:hypothetical protein